MDFPARSASSFVLVRTRPWAENPLCCQERILSAHSGKKRQDLAGENLRQPGVFQARDFLGWDLGRQASSFFFLRLQ
jgi:hypothetical protein